MRWLKSSVLGLEDYFVEQDFSCVKLNQNESPVDFPPDLKGDIFQRLLKASWNRYPLFSPVSLLKKISRYTDFPCAGIMVGNSSNELIQTVIYAVCNTGDRIVVVKPGFPVYKRVADIMGIDVREVLLTEGFAFDTAALKQEAKKARLLIISSPNNPTGTAISPEAIEEIVRDVNTMVVVDEAYFEFYKHSAQHLIEKHENLLIIRTFSKALNLAGIRLGYMIGNDRVIPQLFKARLPFSVGVFQQAAGEVILENIRFVEKSVARLIRERERIFLELSKMDSIVPIPSLANFILFRSDNLPALNLFQHLRREGVLLRIFKGDELKNHLRVTVGTEEENGIFLKKLKGILYGVKT